MEGVEVVEYTFEYPHMNIELKQNDIKRFELGLLICYLKELKRGMMVKQVYKTTKYGTLIKYKAIKSRAEWLKYKELIKNMVEDYNTKYTENLNEE